MDIKQYIEDQSKDAKKIQLKNYPNWDIDIMFKIGRKNHTINMTNLDYETKIADINKENNEWLAEYNKELQEATKTIADKYKDKIEPYNKLVTEASDEFLIEWIDTYLNNI